jgi:hypothetical protein
MVVARNQNLIAVLHNHVSFRNILGRLAVTAGLLFFYALLITI